MRPATSATLPRSYALRKRRATMNPMILATVYATFPFAAGKESRSLVGRLALPQMQSVANKASHAHLINHAAVENTLVLHAAKRTVRAAVLLTDMHTGAARLDRRAISMADAMRKQHRQPPRPLPPSQIWSL